MAVQKKSEFLTTEDWWAIWIGFFLIILGLIIFLNQKPDGMDEAFSRANTIMLEESKKSPFKTVEWFIQNDSKESIKATNEPIGEFLQNLTSKPRNWSSNPLHAFYLSDDAAKEKSMIAKEKYDMVALEAEQLKSAALESQAIAARYSFEDSDLNENARNNIESWRAAHRESSAAKKKIPKSGYNNFLYIVVIAVFLAFVFGFGLRFMGLSYSEFIGGFFFILFLAVISYLIEGQSVMKEYGLGYALWAIVIGLIISNTVGTPKWVMNAAQTEYYIKTGLVLLGAEILFGKIIQIGLPGLMVAWIVTPVVIIGSFIFGKRVLKVASDKLNITMSAAMSVCGVSAAIATAAACKAKKEELTLAVGLSLIFTAIMMVLMPMFIKAVGMTEILGGAWMGGVIDSTGAVAAAGAFLGEKALYVSATIKMIQNILIGVVAFFVAVYWALKMEQKEDGTKPNAMEIWYRFPKFVIGFAVASILASVIASIIGNDASYTLIDNGLLRGFTKNLRGWMFCLAFVSIGLSTNFKELSEQFSGGKPFILYIFGQSFNLFLTLLIAWLAFYIIFPHITELI